MRIGILLITGLTLCAQASRDPLEVLHRARARLLETVNRLPKYTCVQTIDRSYYGQPSLPSGANCEHARNAHAAGQRSLELTDRLRLDVAVANGEEIYSWAGAGRFESKHLPELIGGGPIGTGSFGPFLISIFGDPAIRFEYQGEETEGTQTLLAYRFHVPRELSHYELQAGHEKRKIAYEGTFWLDPASAELRRLLVHAGNLAEGLGICEATTTVSFERLRIGDGVYLLPRESRLESVSTGLESDSLSTYSGCREYRGGSVVHFEGAEPVTAALPALKNLQSGGLPRGLSVVLAFEKEVDWDVAAAGDVLTAKVASDVVDRRSKRTLVPAGAVARGRILRVAHELTPRPYFLLAIEFETLEWKGGTTRFSAVVDPKGGPLSTLSVSVDQLAHERRAGGAVPPLLPTGAKFSAGRTLVFPSSAERYVTPPGYESRWVTGSTTSD